jgi:hypothetical protein
MSQTHFRLVCRPSVLVLVLGGLAAAACQQAAPRDSRVTPIYSKETGRLEELAADRDGDGRNETHAYMDGTHLKYIAIDRNGDGRVDRWEYYTAGQGDANSAGAAFDKHTMLVRADEANGPDDRITRHEHYENGVIASVEEDTDFDGRIDKWERYEHGALTQMDLDLSGRGTPDRRLVYRQNGSLDHVERDVAGDGHFVPIPAGALPVLPPPTTGRQGGVPRP